MDSYRKEIVSLFDAPNEMSVQDCVNTFADPAQVLLAYTVFNPEFTEVNGEPVLGPLSDLQVESIEELMGTSSASDVLDSFRWLEVPYLFNDRSRLSEIQDNLLANLMVVSWKSKLISEYPDRKWNVRILSANETGSVVAVGFKEI